MEAKSVIHCHCGQCRRLSGGAFSTWLSLAKEALHIKGVKSLLVFEVSSNVSRHFCKTCGTHVYSADRRYPEILGVPAGIVDGPFPRPKAHYFVAHQAAWHTLCDELPQFGGESGFEPLST